MAQQSQHLAAVASDLGAWKAQHEKDTAILKEQVARVQSGVRSLQEAAAEQLQAVAAAAAAALSDVGSKTETHAQSAVAAAEAAGAAAAAALCGLGQALEGQVGWGV